MLPVAQPGQIIVNDDQRKKRIRGVVILIAGLFFAGLVVIIPRLSQSLARAQKQNCISGMVSVGLAGRMWSNDHDEHFPRTFTEMSNELSSPKVLICHAAPDAEKVREQMRSWVTFDERRSSYEIVNPGASEENTNTIFFRCKIHGHLGYVDDSIFDGSRRLSGSEAKGGVPAR